MTDHINQLILGDALDILDNIPDESVDLVFADPPFNAGRNADYEYMVDDSMSDARYFAWCNRWISKCFAKLKPHGNFLSMNKSENIGSIMNIMDEYGVFKNLISWDKKLPTFRKGSFANRVRFIAFYSKSEQNYPRKKIKMPDILEVSKLVGGYMTPDEAITDDKGDFIHKMQLPEKLLRIFITTLCPKEGVVLDPFCGSGTTLAVAKKQMRVYIGIELVETYYRAAKERLQNITPDHKITKWFG